jgi:hypothetical protein
MIAAALLFLSSSFPAPTIYLPKVDYQLERKFNDSASASSTLAPHPISFSIDGRRSVSPTFKAADGRRFRFRWDGRRKLSIEERTNRIKEFYDNLDIERAIHNHPPSDDGPKQTGCIGCGFLPFMILWFWSLVALLIVGKYEAGMIAFGAGMAIVVGVIVTILWKDK